jgi:hypothetical protein
MPTMILLRRVLALGTATLGTRRKGEVVTAYILARAAWRVVWRYGMGDVWEVLLCVASHGTKKIILKVNLEQVECVVLHSQ